MRIRSPSGSIEILGRTKQQHVAQEIKDRFIHRRVTAFGCSDRALDDLFIFVAYRLIGLDVRSINGKASNRLAHGARERLKRKISVPSVLLR